MTDNKMNRGHERRSRQARKQQRRFKQKLLIVAVASSIGIVYCVYCIAWVVVYVYKVLQ